MSVARAVRKYPAKSKVVRKELVRESVCPECGGNLHPTNRCRACGFNASKIAKQLQPAEADQ